MCVKERSNREIEREILSYKPKPYSRKDKPIERKINIFRTGDKIKIGSLEVEPIHVDHSVPGAYGFIIYTTQGPIAYTGDIRLHGTNSQMTRDFIEKAKEVKPIALIAEGTRIKDEEKQESEEKVYLPKIDDDDIIIYVPKKKSGTYSDSDYKSKEDQFVSRNNAWTAEQIDVRESRVLCAIGFFSFTALIDIKPEPGAVYIHSASEPYNEEQVIDQKRIEN